MLLSEYIRENPLSAAVLFTDRVSKANAVIRQLNIASDISGANMMTSTVREIAEEIVTAYLAYHEPEKADKFSFISPKACRYILTNILKTQNFSSFKISSLSAATVRDIMNCLNEIRANGLTEDGKNSSDLKLSDIKQAINLFERELEDRDLYDEVRTISKAAEYLKKEDVKEWMFGLGDRHYLFLSGDHFSSTEKDLMEVLAQLSGSSLTEAEYLSEFTKENINAEYSVYECYGIPNEVRLVIDEIYDRKTHSAKVAYDAVTVCYTDTKYINFIKAAFDAFKIPYKIKSGNPAVGLNTIRFMLSCIGCAEDNFLYAKLEKVILNPLITFKNINEDNVVSNPVRAYYNALNAGIGWGRDRYQAYIKANIDEPGKGADPFFLSFLKDYIEIFDEGNSCRTILEKLIDFTYKYTYKQNQERRLVKKELKEQVDDLKYVDDGNYTMKDKLETVMEAVESLKVSDDTEDANAVNIGQLTDEVPVCQSNFYQKA